MAKKKRHVVITTDSSRRGVFGGYLESYDPETGRAVLSEARMAVYWSSDCRGVLGLAAGGPTKNCRIGPAAPRIELDGVTAVIDCTAEAIKAWKAEPWS